MLSVIDYHLDKTGNPYLVGKNCTFADLMWVPWDNLIGMAMGPDFAKEWEEKYPKCLEWHQRLMDRESVKKVMELVKEHTPEQAKH